MKRPVITAVSLVLVLALTASSVRAQPTRHGRRAGATRPATESGQPVLDWNNDLLSIVGTPGAQPPTIHPTWSFAILHAAIYDAVNSIDRSHQPYVIAARAPRDASGHLCSSPWRRRLRDAQLVLVAAKPGEFFDRGGREAIGQVPTQLSSKSCEADCAAPREPPRPESLRPTWESTGFLPWR
jgi:hypothetical protein